MPSELPAVSVARVQLPAWFAYSARYCGKLDTTMQSLGVNLAETEEIGLGGAGAMAEVAMLAT